MASRSALETNGSLNASQRRYAGANAIRRARAARAAPARYKRAFDLDALIREVCRSQALLR